MGYYGGGIIPDRDFYGYYDADAGEGIPGGRRQAEYKKQLEEELRLNKLIDKNPAKWYGYDE